MDNKFSRPSTHKQDCCHQHSLSLSLLWLHTPSSNFPGKCQQELYVSDLYRSKIAHVLLLFVIIHVVLHCLVTCVHCNLATFAPIPWWSIQRYPKSRLSATAYQPWYSCIVSSFDSILSKYYAPFQRSSTFHTNPLWYVFCIFLHLYIDMFD